MYIAIHFFRNRNLERLDYEKLIEYIGSAGSCEYNEYDGVFEIIFKDPDFDFPYRFLITKRSQVKSIYNLNVNYVNTNVLVEIPFILPSFIIKTTLMFLMDLCRTFQLEVYYEGINYEGVKNIEPFNIPGLMDFLEKERDVYLKDHPEIEVHYVNREKLMNVCNYQLMMPYLPEKIKDEATINPYIVMLDNDYKQIVFSIEWIAGTAMVFPPNLDYIHVEEDGIVSIIPADVFYKYCQKYMYELRDYMPNVVLLLLCGRNVNKAKKMMKKIRKEAVPHTLFTEKEIIDLIEK